MLMDSVGLEASTVHKDSLLGKVASANQMDSVNQVDSECKEDSVANTKVVLEALKTMVDLINLEAQEHSASVAWILLIKLKWTPSDVFVQGSERLILITR